jgi:hypothetical protein
MTAFIKVVKDHEQHSQSENNDLEDFTKFNLDDDKLLGMASLLVDEGYGSFDRCYNLIRCLRGDLNKARDVLSQFIFQESQFWYVKYNINCGNYINKLKNKQWIQYLKLYKDVQYIDQGVVICLLVKPLLGISLNSKWHLKKDVKLMIKEWKKKNKRHHKILMS